MPLIRPAKHSGIIILLGWMFRRVQMLSTTGIKIATTPVELITEPSIATASIRNSVSRHSLLPACLTSISPIWLAIPVRTSPSPTTNSAAIMITLGSLKPASTSLVVSTPLSASDTIISIATASMRGLLRTNRMMAINNRDKTQIRSVFMAGVRF